MDILKLFPTLFLDFLSKVIPGSIFLLVFQNRYLPPTELVLQLLSLQSLPEGWLSWYKIGMILITSYVIGIFIAILSNWLDGLLMSRYWFKALKQTPDKYIFPIEQPVNFKQILESSTTFSLFVDHCRSYVSVNSTASAAMLEKYRTAYRLFVGLSLLFLALPFGLGGSQWSFLLLLAPASALLAFFMSKRYLFKSIQFFSLSQNAGPATSPSAKKSTEA